MIPTQPGPIFPTGSSARAPVATSGQANLADILERVLDKGIVIAGDIRVNLLDIELLTIKIRLIVASVDRAREMGIDWWERDPSLSSGRPPVTMTSPHSPAMTGPLTTPMGSTVSTPLTDPVAGPVVSGPVMAGPVMDGPVMDGPVMEGPVMEGPVTAGPGDFMAGPGE